MGKHVNDFFQESGDESARGHFHKVIALHKLTDVDWENLKNIVPDLCRGWFELTRLPKKDRIDFTRDYWQTKLPYRLGLNEFLSRFFDRLDDISIFITQKKFDDPYETNFVYSLKGDSGFYRGGSPATEADLITMQKNFSDVIIPADFQAFLQIHNGFWKTTDCTGISHSNHLKVMYESFQAMLAKELEPPKTAAKKEVNPLSLIPFYESFGMPFFQCFWAEWYPEDEMGNVYYSHQTKTISYNEKIGTGPETMAFSTFIDWLMFYLESVD